MKTLLLGLVATALSGCMAGAGYSYTTGFLHGAASDSSSSSSSAAPPQAPSGAVTGPAYAPGEDQHWFSSDDYLVAPINKYGEQVQRMRVAKMIDPPAAGSKGEARFLVANGSDLWTGNFFQSRVVGPADLVVNALAFCHETSSFRTETSGPRSKQESRNGEWFFGAITDTSDAYKGRISVGSHACPIDAVRVPLR